MWTVMTWLGTPAISHKRLCITVILLWLRGAVRHDIKLQLCTTQSLLLVINSDVRVNVIF